MPAPKAGRDALVTDALVGVLEIAWEGQSEESLNDLRHRAARMPLQEKEKLLGNLVKLDEVTTLIRSAAAGRLAPTGIAKDLEGWQDSMVTKALEPLSELAGVPRARETVDALPPVLRAEILLRAVNQGSGPG